MVSQGGNRRRITGVALRAASLAGGLLAGFVVVWGLSLGACHSVGGFCSGEFDEGNAEAYWSAIVAAAFVGPLLALPFRRNVWLLGGLAIAGVAVTGLFVAAQWPR